MKILRYLKNLVVKFFLSPPKGGYIYVALGDSTVEGVGASSPDKTFPAIINSYLQSVYKKTSFYNLGRRGALVKDLLKYQLEESITLNAHLITVSIGANNVMRGGRLSTFEKDLRLLFNRLTTETSARIVINNIPDFSAARTILKPIRNIYSYRARSFNNVIKKLSDEYGVVCIDVHSYTKVVFKNYSEFISSDGLHPSDLGYALWANIIITRLNFLNVVR